MNFLFFISIILVLCVFLNLLFTFKGPTHWDRLLGLNMISAKIILSIIFLGIITNRGFLIDIALIYAMLGFLGTIFLAKFLESGGGI